MAGSSTWVTTGVPRPPFTGTVRKRRIRIHSQTTPLCPAGPLPASPRGHKLPDVASLKVTGHHTEPRIHDNDARHNLAVAAKSKLQCYTQAPLQAGSRYLVQVPAPNADILHSGAQAASAMRTGRLCPETHSALKAPTPTPTQKGVALVTAPITGSQVAVGSTANRVRYGWGKGVDGK